MVSELVARSPQALLEVDANGLVLGASARAAALLNRGQSPLEGLTLASFLAAEDASALAARLRAAVLGEPVEEMTCGVREPPGNAFLLGVTILSLPGVQPPRALVVLRDLTAERHARDEATRKEAEEHRDAAAEHRRAEGDLRQQALENRKLTDLGKLVSGIAHELRTPLTFVGNVMELERQRLSALAAKRPDLSEALTELRDLNGSAVMGLDRIARLVRDLRPLTKNRPHRSTRMDLADLVTDAVRIFRGSRRDDTRVELDLEATHLLDLDREDMVNAVLNLLNNAADAMQGKGRIVVQTRNREIPPEIRVLDQGP
ncbi:MAG TPA: PAS domain-containing protein, partial [Candidatus Thermoplasmatota archaeon]|nr:PAS domain-containing protein [Candidatus Thermoplasmatota archaeon]